MLSIWVRIFGSDFILKNPLSLIFMYTHVKIYLQKIDDFSYLKIFLFVFKILGKY